jgi:hypothetical protein
MNDLKYHVCPRDDRDAQYDGYGIFLTYTCGKCHKVKMAGYRSDIGSRYECDEPIEDET